MNIVNVIKTYRTELMGMAILWVVFYHLHPQNHLLNKLTALGYGGVDIFFLVSGFGLFYSYHQSKSVTVYWKKRLMRIFPIYLLFVIAFLLLNNKLTLVNFVVHSSTLGFWFSSSAFFEWYVPSLILFYLISPLFIRLVSFNIYIFAFITVLLTILSIALWHAYPFNRFQILCYSRIPIFMIGIYLGYISKKENNQGIINGKAIWILMAIIGILFLYFCQANYTESQLWASALYWLPFIIIVPGLIIVSGYLLNYQIKPVNKLLNWFGTISYELYLTHILIFRWLNAQNDFYLNNGFFKIMLSMILTAFIHYFVAKPIYRYIGK